MSTEFTSLTASDRPYRRLCDKLDKYLPEKYRNNIVRKLIFSLFLKGMSVRIDTTGTPIHNKELNNSYKSLYRPSLNKINLDSGKSVLSMMLDDNIILRDYYSEEDGKPYYYRLNFDVIPYTLMYDVIIQYLENYKKYASSKFTDITDDFVIDEIIRGDHDKLEYVIIDPENVTLDVRAEIAIVQGRIGMNYMVRDLIIDRYNSLINKTKFLRDSDPTYNLINNNTNTAEAKRGLWPGPEGGAAHGRAIAPARDYFSELMEFLSSYEFKSKHKLVSIFESTMILMNNNTILGHRAPQKICYTGRFFETKNLGTTGLDRRTKAANYELMSKITGKVINNYDIRGSQLACILSYGKKHGFDYNDIDLYVKDKSYRQTLADRIGIPVGLLKKLILILIFGGHDTIPIHESNSFKDTFFEYGYSDINEILKLHQSFKRVVRGIRDNIYRWYEDCETILNHHNHSRGNDRYYNGVTIVKKARLKKRKHISAFLLQGMEASFILELINQSDRKLMDYYFISYEYDGLITFGEIPEKAIEYAKIVSGFSEAILELKAIC